MIRLFDAVLTEDSLSPHVEHQLTVLERKSNAGAWYLDLDCVDCDLTIATVTRKG